MGLILVTNMFFHNLATEAQYLRIRQYLAVVQNSPSGIWPTLAKKCHPFASSLAKLSRSLFSHVGQVGVSTWIPTSERTLLYWCYPKLLRDRMTSARKSHIPFANTIASSRESMFQALNSQKHKCRMPSTPSR